MTVQIITAIYDKKSKTLGRPIYQENIEKAISGVQDAINSMNTQGEYLMPAHREHPEDYCLMMLGYYDNERETASFDADTGEYKTTLKTEPAIKIDQKVIIEFKDLQIKDVQSKISAETVYQMLDKVYQEMSTNIYESMLKAITDAERNKPEIIKKRSFWSWKK